MKTQGRLDNSPFYYYFDLLLGVKISALDELSDSTPVYPVFPKPVKELADCDKEPLTVKEWKTFFSFTPSDQGDTDCDSDSKAHGKDYSDSESDTDGDSDSDGPIAAYVVYYGHRMGVFRNW